MWIRSGGVETGSENEEEEKDGSIGREELKND